MATREEIRKGIQDILIEASKTKLRIEAVTTDLIIVYLHSQGVVIKVDRELPPLSDYDKRRTTDESVDFQDGFIVAKAVMLKVGYEAVEPLI